MQGFKIAFIIIAALIMLLHIGSVIFKKRIAQILTYVNLGLHIPFIITLMALETSFEFMALSFMLSLLVYLSLSFVNYKVRIRRDERGDV